MARTPQQIKHTRLNWQAPNFTSMDGARIHISYYVNFGACQSWRPCSIHILTTPFFWAQSAPADSLPSSKMQCHALICSTVAQQSVFCTSQCKYTRTHTRTHTLTHTHTHTHAHTHSHTHSHTRTHTHSHTYSHTHAHTHTNTNTP